MKKLLILLVVFFSIKTHAQIITTVAGNGTGGYSGDGGAATAAEFYIPYGVACDAAGNLYIADNGNQRIRKVSTAGIISTFAGEGTGGYSGDGGQASAAKLNTPIGLGFDSFSNLYICDIGNSCIRKVTSSGIITTIAGNGTAGYNGDGGQAIAAKLNSPTCIAFDVMGNLYIADEGNNRIRKVNTAGIISTVAGNGALGGYSGDGGQAIAAKLNSPSNITFDGAGNLYITDMANFRIRKVNTAGIISTFAGTGTQGYTGDGGNATAAELNIPYGIVFDAMCNLFIADDGNNVIRKINTAGIISTIAGNGIRGFSGDGGQASMAELYEPLGIALDALGNLYIADYDNFRVRKVTLNCGECAGIEQLTNKNELNIYPNPSNGLFNLSINQFDNRKKSSIEVYNLIGECVHSQIATSSNCQIDLSSLANGIYNLSVISNEGVINKRLIIAK